MLPFRCLLRSLLYFPLSCSAPLDTPRAFAFENLQVYQNAISFANDVCDLTRDVPRGYFFVSDPLELTVRMAYPKVRHGSFESQLEEIARMLSGLIN